MPKCRKPDPNKANGEGDLQSEVVSVCFFFPSPASRLPLALIVITAIVVILFTGVIRYFRDDVGQEIQHLVLGDGLFQMSRGDPFRITILRFLRRFGDEGNHEEFERFRYTFELACPHEVDGEGRYAYKQQLV